MNHTKASKPNGLRAQWHEGVSGLKQLRDDWMQLTSDAALFARYEWYSAIAMHLVSDGHKIWFCRISDADDRPLSIIPAQTGSAIVRPFGKLPALNLGSHGQLVTFDFPLAPDADALEVGKTMLDAFKDHPFNWQVISWPRVMADSNAAKVATALGNRLCDIAPSSVCKTFYTGNNPDPVTGFEAYDMKSRSLRKVLAKHTRRLARQGPVEMRLASEQGDIDAFFQEFLRLESSGWKGMKGVGTSIALIPSARAFYSSLLAASNESVAIDIALLYCGDKAVAGEYLIRAARWEHVYKSGYDEDFRDYSPGQLLLQLVIEHAKASEGIDRVSMVTGFDWMDVWSPIPEHTLQINTFRSRWRSFIVHLGRNALNRYRRARLRWKTKRAPDDPLPRQEQPDREAEKAAESHGSD